MKKQVYLLSGIIALIDQIAKIIATNFLVGNSIPIINNIFYLTYVENKGALWGILSGNRYILIILSILAIYGIIKYFLLDENIKKIELISYSLMLGGVIGNLIDRLFYGYVVDFLDFRWLSYNYPVFNIADSSIVIGVILLLIHMIYNSLSIRSERENNKSNRK